jgi:hypothetical protein
MDLLINPYLNAKSAEGGKEEKSSNGYLNN